MDLFDLELPETLEGIVKDAGLEPGDLLLEITESAYTENPEIVNVIKSLRDRGFPIEMDDFGTGYSSLNMITTLPIDALKLDMQFIRTAFRGNKDTRLLEAVIGLAKSLVLPTIAEGVETEKQMKFLQFLSVASCKVSGCITSKAITLSFFLAILIINKVISPQIAFYQVFHSPRFPLFKRKQYAELLF